MVRVQRILPHPHLTPPGSHLYPPLRPPGGLDWAGGQGTFAQEEKPDGGGRQSSTCHLPPVAATYLFYWGALQALPLGMISHVTLELGVQAA